MGMTKDSLAEAMGVLPGAKLIVETEGPALSTEVVLWAATEGTPLADAEAIDTVSGALVCLQRYMSEVGRPGADQLRRARAVSLLGGLLETLGNDTLRVTRVENGQPAPSQESEGGY